jgi:hypothetical protein
MTELKPEPARARVFAALDFAAPYLIEKLVKDGHADDEAEAALLFREARRYMVIAALDPTRAWHMYSLRVDECWHQFILFTRQYMEFCRLYFGRYIPHSPSNAPEAETKPANGDSSFAEFATRYADLFGEALPEIWNDARSLRPHRRVLNAHAGGLTLRRDGEDIALLGPGGRLLLAVNDLAEPALAFIAATRAFYVRELPGGLDDEEKVALVEALVEAKLLRVA